MRLKRLKEPTEICKICFDSFKPKSLRTITSMYYPICTNCYKKMKPKFYHHKINNVKVLSIYDYDDEMKSLIYILKGCYDIELSKAFLRYFAKFLHFLYLGYYMIPIPSNEVDDKKREFNHVVEIFKDLNLPMLKIMYKNKPYKQSDYKAKDRHKISKVLELSDIEIIKNKKILLVDDIFTTGSTLKAAIDLVRKGKPRKIKAITIAMTRGHSDLL